MFSFGQSLEIADNYTNSGFQDKDEIYDASTPNFDPPIIDSFPNYFEKDHSIISLEQSDYYISENSVTKTDQFKKFKTQFIRAFGKPFKKKLVDLIRRKIPLHRDEQRNIPLLYKKIQTTPELKEYIDKCLIYNKKLS